jgi:hypothetical protein
MMPQPDNELIQQVLQVAARATEPICRFDIADAIDPGTDDLQEDTPEHEAFTLRRLAIIRAAVNAEQTGLLECVRPATGGEGDLLQLSARGREQLQVRG